MFLDLPLSAVGQIGGGKTDRTGIVDDAVIQSLHRKEEVKDFVAQYGQETAQGGSGCTRISTGRRGASNSRHGQLHRRGLQ